MITAEQARTRLGLRADDSGMDTVIDALVAEAVGYARAYCRLRPGEEIPEALVLTMVAEDYGRFGGAGITRRGMGGATEEYRGHYSDGVMALLRRLRHAGGIERC